MMKKTILLLAGILMTVSIPILSQAGTLDEMGTAVDSYYSSGAISDIDVKATLSDLVAKAKATSDAQAQSAYRTSFIDVVDAFTGGGVTSEAAAALKSLAQP